MKDKHFFLSRIKLNLGELANRREGKRESEKKRDQRKIKCTQGAGGKRGKKTGMGGVFRERKREKKINDPTEILEGFLGEYKKYHPTGDGTSLVSGVFDQDSDQ